ncbi:MAG: dynamin family protein [archaeon]|nr:dynamin family protein [archaeon]
MGQDLVEEMNELQQVLGLLQTDLSLPQIVVVGSQSSGKSSVMEQIVGRDFLPRGTGIVTRRPLVLQLMPSSSSQSQPNNALGKAVAWAEFAHLPGQKFDDFRKVRQEIERETDRVAPGQAVSSVPITLKVFTPEAVPLTLVDLPGLTRVPTGNQPRDIEFQLRDMITGQIKGENAIILAVHSATQDLATSDALQIAHSVDPKGDRTIGVLTKVDAMDRGTDLGRVMDGTMFPLRLGYVPVVNRCQSDIDRGVPIDRALEAEARFFLDHPVYQHYADRCGSHHLAHKCNRLLTEHIHRTLPSISHQVHATLNSARNELAAYGQPLSADPSEQGWMLLQIINSYASLYVATVNGQSADDGVLNTEKLNAGARLRVLFHETFFDSLQQIDPTEGLTIAEYRTAIRNAAGPRPSLFVPDPAFQLLMKKQLQRLKAPCLQLVEMCFAEMSRIVSQMETTDLRRFPSLKTQLQQITSSVLKQQMQPTQIFVEELVNIELAYINTNHPEFSQTAHRQVSAERVPPPSSGRDPTNFNASASSESPFSNPISRFFFGGKKTQETPRGVSSDGPNDELLMGEKPSERELIQIRLIKQLLRDYFSIVVRNLQDSVIKAVWHHLIDGSKKHLHHALVSQLYKPEKCAQLLREPPSIAAKRNQLSDKVTAYQKASQILTDFEQRRRFE